MKIIPKIMRWIFIVVLSLVSCALMFSLIPYTRYFPEAFYVLGFWHIIISIVYLIVVFIVFASLLSIKEITKNFVLYVIESVVNLILIVLAGINCVQNMIIDVNAISTLFCIAECIFLLFLFACCILSVKDFISYQKNSQKTINGKKERKRKATDNKSNNDDDEPEASTNDNVYGKKELW